MLLGSSAIHLTLTADGKGTRTAARLQSHTHTSRKPPFPCPQALFLLAMPRVGYSSLFSFTNH